MKKILTSLAALLITLAAIAQPKAGRVYTISAPDGALLSISESSDQHNASLVMAAEGDVEAWAQKWAAVDCGSDDGTFALVNPHSRMGIDQALSTSAKTLLTWFANTGNSNQQFTIVETDGGCLISNASGKFVQVQSDGKMKMASKGTVFTFTETDNDEACYPGACVRIKNVQNGKVIGAGDKAALNTYLQMEDADEEQAAQVWRLRIASYSESNGSASYMYILVNAKSGLSLDMAISGRQYKALLWTAAIGSSNQMVTVNEDDGAWVIANARDSYYTLSATEYDSYIHTDLAFMGDLARWTMVPAVPPVTERNDWENERVFGINKLEGHAAFMPYRNEAAVRADAARWQRAWLDPQGADWMSLDGTWKFKYVPTTADRPLDFFEEGFDASGWDNTPVPSCMEMLGYDRPMYINVQYAFDDNPPYVTANVNGSGASPVGSYLRAFTLPAGWESRRTILCFEGISSGAYVWVNGHSVGYTQGGNMDAEFDVTDYVRAGENTLAVQVFRWTDGSYLEGQDMFHLSGIHRPVSIISVPKTYIRDHVITADYSQGYDLVGLKVELDVEGDDTDKTFCVTLVGPDGANVWTSGQTTERTIETIVPSPQLWSAENPVLYTVLVSQSGADGQEMAFATKWGFCDLTYDSKLLYVNGQREYFKGVNTQDTHPVTGKTFDVATMWRDLTMMKQANVNMVRTSHYPRMTRMNDMMLYLGMYICDEADVECHRNWDDGGSPYKIAAALSWQPAMLDRQRRMVQRDRNNSAVVMWSMGNESYVGQNFKAGYDMIHAMDHRPVHYEGATRFWSNNTVNYTDVRSQMYPTQSTIRTQLDNPTQPYFMCEYGHAMGNAIGNLSDTWRKHYDSANGIGGCIWDWVDQSIYEPADILSGDTIAENGFPKYRSGYDFVGPHQGNFCNNGIITADRAWTAKLTEVKAAYQYVQFTAYKDGELTIKNRLRHHSPDELYTLNFIVLRNGVVVKNGSRVMPACATDQTATMPLEPGVDMTDGAEYTLQVEARLKEATDWAEAGYPMSTGEFVLQERADLPEVTPAATEVFTVTSKNNKRVMNTGIQFYATGGNVSKLVIGGLSIIDDVAYSPVYNDFFYNENDTYYGFLNGNETSSDAIVIDSDQLHATYTQTNTGTKCNSTFKYDIYGNGIVDLTARFEPQTSDLRRIGFSMSLPGTFNDVEYYARGPWENYCDRQDGSYLCRVRTTVDDMYEVYSHPQSNGDHQDMRELRLVDEDTKDTLLITSQGQVGFSLSRYDELYYARYAFHPSDLVRTDRIQAHFDYMVRGVGNKSCGAETALAPYRCPESGSYEFTLRLERRAYNSSDAVSAPAQQPVIRYADGVVTAEGQDITVYDVGGARVASGSDAVSLKGLPRGIYLVKAAGVTYKFTR